jgi:hypothetical protein
VRCPGFLSFRQGRAQEPPAWAAAGLDATLDQNACASRDVPVADRATSIARGARDQTDLRELANREAQRNRSARGEGITSFPNVRAATILDYSTDETDHRHLVERVQHALSPDGVYRARVSTRPLSSPHASSDYRYHPPRRIPRPVMHGVFRARVTESYDWDHKREGVEVTLAGFEDTLPVPLAPPAAGPTRAHVALPSKGSEVLVAFEGGDPDQPYVVAAVLRADSVLADSTEVLTLAVNGTKIAFTGDDDGASRLALHSEQSLTMEAADLLEMEAAGPMKLSAGGSLQVDSGELRQNVAGTYRLSTPYLEIDAGAVRIRGLVRCDTLVAQRVIGTTYAPGAGNIL